jgi:hypothetical protein
VDAGRREGVTRSVADPSPQADDKAATPDPADLLDRLERQATEIARLEDRARALERALAAERQARRRLARTLEEERKAAVATPRRSRGSPADEELERLRRAAVAAEEQVRLAWSQLRATERRLAWKERRLWRKLLRRPPAQRPSSERPS